MRYGQENAASRWISVEEYLPRNEEIVAFWVKLKNPMMLYGVYYGDSQDGFFVNYLNPAKIKTEDDLPERFSAGSGNVMCWCRFGFPREENYDKK